MVSNTISEQLYPSKISEIMTTVLYRPKVNPMDSLHGIKRQLGMIETSVENGTRLAIYDSFGLGFLLPLNKLE